MQIHEMFQRKTLTEVDLFGPSSVFNVGREALKNPKAWVNSNALGAAQQQSAGNVAKHYAPEVTKIAQANIAPLAKQLAQGWRQIASQLPLPIASPTTVPGTPTNTFAQQPAGFKAATTNQPAGIPGQYKPPVQPTYGTVKPTATPAKKPTAVDINKMKAGPGRPGQADYERLQQRIQQAQKAKGLTEDAAGDYRTEFINYARKVLGARGVDIKAMRNDPVTNQALNRILSQITAAHNDPDKQTLAVEQYFTTALNKWHEIQLNPVKYNQAFPDGQGPTGRSSTGASVKPGEAEQDINTTLDKIGISKTQLGQLAAAAAEANKGSMYFRSTGNPVLDSVLKLAGMRPQA